jgi:hypothetical protein
MENYILFQTFFNSLDAHNAKNHLASAEIRAEIIGDINATTYNVFTQANGGIRLYVHKDDVENAIEILGQPSE